MTSEVALMNRLAVALAADSATTITYWDNGTRHQRYFKGANKIFNLSIDHPIGLMTFGSGTLDKVPWELAVKAYRASRNGKGFDRVADYPIDLFRYLASKEMFPVQHQESQLIRGVCETAGNIGLGILFGRAEIKNEKDEASKKSMAAERLKELIKEIEADRYLTPDCEKIAETIQSKHMKAIQKEFAAGGLHEFTGRYLDTTLLLEISSVAYLKERWTDLEKTGLVFAGYGTKEIFPSVEQYECWGVVAGTVIQRRLIEECKAVDFDIPSEIVAVAQDDMVNTFVFGASMHALVEMGESCNKCISSLLSELVDAGHLAADVDAGSFKANAHKSFQDRVRQYIWEQHATPLKRVIGMLPVDELAALAETFVSIESLKERVTNRIRQRSH